MLTRKSSAAAALLSLTLLVSACGASSTKPGPSPSSGAASSNPTPTASGKPADVSLDKLTGLELPAALTMSPGSVQTIAVSGVTSGKPKQDVSGNAGLTIKSSRPELVAVEQGGKLKAAANAASGQTALITVSYGKLTADTKVTVKATLQDTVAVNAKGIPVVTNPTDIAVVVNKKRTLADTYAPIDLVEPNVPFSFKEKLEKRMLRKVAAQALEQLFDQAGKDGIKLYGISGYRSFATQKSVFAGNVKSQGEEEAGKVSAQPGQSEHQTGLAIDVSSASANFGLEESFGTTAEGKWLVKHAADSGFIIRYPKGKESITGYSYEPWHIRYVGVDIAKEISERGITLEEYFQDAVPVSNPTK